MNGVLGSVFSCVQLHKDQIGSSLTNVSFHKYLMIGVQAESCVFVIFEYKSCVQIFMLIYIYIYLVRYPELVEAFRKYAKISDKLKI